MTSTEIKMQLGLIQAELEEKLNSFHKKNGESLNSRQLLNDFIAGIGYDFDKLAKELEADNY